MDSLGVGTNRPSHRCNAGEKASDVDAFEMANSSTEATPVNVADASFDKATRLTVLYLEILFGTVGNLLVGVWLWRNRRRKSRMIVIISNLAIADLLVIAFACVMQVTWEHVDRLWLAGNVVCKLLKFTQSLSIMASVNMLVALSIDRHHAIRKPLHHPSLVRYLVAAGWSLATIMSLPQLGVFSVNVVRNKTVCESMFRTRPPSDRQAYLTYVNLIVFILPTIIMFICYVRLFARISSTAADAGRETSSPLRTRIDSESTWHTNFRTYASNDLSTSNDRRKGSGRGLRSKPNKIYLHRTQSHSLHRAKIKSLKMAVVVVSMFVVCSAPYHVLEMIYSYGQHSIVPSSVAGVIGAMAVANSAMNPFVILYFNLDASTCCHSRGIHRRHTSDKTKRTNLPQRVQRHATPQLELQQQQQQQHVTTARNRHGPTTAADQVNNVSSSLDSVALSVTSTPATRNRQTFGRKIDVDVALETTAICSKTAPTDNDDDQQLSPIVHEVFLHSDRMLIDAQCIV